MGALGRGGQDKDVGSVEVYVSLLCGNEVAFDDKDIGIDNTIASEKVRRTGIGKESELGGDELGVDTFDVDTGVAGVLIIERLP